MLYLKGSFIGVRPQMNRKGRRVGELLSTELASEASRGVSFAQRAAAVRHEVFPQRRAGGESPSARGERTTQWRLTRVREPMKVETVLSDASVAAHITLQLTPDLPSSLSLIPAAYRGLPSAALHVRVEHCLIQELRAAGGTRLWFFIYRKNMT